MGLSSDQLANAVGLAVVANICLRETRTGHISNWKGFAGPNGSRSGVYSALLAQEGITGPPKPFEGRAGFMKQLNTPFELGALGGGEIPFKVEGTFFKYIPVRYEIQLPILVALEIRQRISLSDVVTIRVHVEKKNALDRNQSPEPWNPTSRETADHSGPYLIGAALVDGGISEKTFTAQRYRAPEIIELIQKISLVEDPQYTAAFPRAFNCRFEVLLKSGEVVTVHRTNPKGHPANPMSDQELEAKFLKQVENIIPSQQSRKLLDTLWTLERLNRISELFPLMVVPETA
jgi:2-methylcitrate dehydratase